MLPLADKAPVTTPSKELSLFDAILPAPKDPQPQVEKEPRKLKTSSIGRDELGEASFTRVRKPSGIRGSQISNAMNNALQEAAASKDPLRWLLVYMRVKVIKMSCKRYAEQLGMRSHSLVTKEKKGIDGNPLSATYFRHLQDWDTRARSSAKNRQTFKKAIRALKNLLINEEEGTPARLLTEWQVHFGAEKFTEATGLDPSKMYLRKKYGEFITFGKFLKIAEQLNLVDLKEPGKTWSNERIREAKRVCFHDGRRQGRSASSLQLSFALEVAGIDFNLSSLQNNLRGCLDENKVRQLFTYDTLPKEACEAVLSLLQQRGVIDSKCSEKILRFNAIDHRRIEQQQLLERIPWTSSQDQIYQIMMEQQIDHEFVARLIYGDISSQRRPKINTVRLSILDQGRYSLQAPFGLIALLVCRTQDEFSQVMDAKRKELHLEFARRPERAPDAEQAIEYKLWGLEFSKLERLDREAWLAKVKDQIGLIARKPLARFNSGILNSPTKVASFFLEGFSNVPFGDRTGFSVPRLKNLAHGRIPYMPLEDFKRLVTNSGHQFSPLSGLIWRLSLDNRPCPNKSQLGLMQLRIFNGLIVNNGVSQTELLSHCKDKPLSDKAARNLLALRDDKAADIHKEKYKEILAAAAIDDRTPLLLANINTLLKSKSYSQVIAQWALSGFDGVDDSIKAQLSNFFALDVRKDLKDLLNLDRDFEANLRLRRALSSGFDKEDSSYKKLELFESCFAHLMNYFPGVAPEDIYSAVATYKGAISFAFRAPMGAALVPNSKDIRVTAPDPKEAVHVNRAGGKLQLCSKALCQMLSESRSESALNGLHNSAPFSHLIAGEITSPTKGGEASLEFLVNTLIPTTLNHIYLNDEARKSVGSVLNFLRAVKQNGHFVFTSYGEHVRNHLGEEAKNLPGLLSQGMFTQLDRIVNLAREIRSGMEAAL